MSSTNGASSKADSGPPGGPLSRTPFPIVGIGASAGGLDAFTQLLRALPADTGMAFVLIQHLDPLHKSFLAEALGKATPMAVSQAANDEAVEPNHVYLIPPDADLSLAAGRLTLRSRTEESPKLHLPIDFFFAALAAECGRHAIGVVLSGTASDGTEGLKAIKAEAGITFAQDPATAKFGGMPQSAIASGVVDYVLPIAGVAEELVRLSRHPYLTIAESAPLPSTEAEQDPVEIEEKSGDAVLTEIMHMIRTVVGVDFREYKSPTFDRRLARRMALRHVDSKERYLDLLKRDADEVRSLCEDALIHVSSFFRDPEVFETLRTDVFPKILKHKTEDAPIRIWVAGCSSGEEVYSLAICLLEFLRDGPQEHPIQIFGSDVSEAAIQKARAGRYADGAMRGISDEQRRRFFTKADSGYRINKTVRDLCVFVRHDLARDPPFSRIDFLSCRNVLIYFHPSLQKRVLQTFHYSLNQPGFMLLGRTESISGFSHLFSPLDRSSKIFTRSASPSGLHFAARAEGQPSPVPRFATPTAEVPRRAGDLGRHLDSLLLARYAPPGVLINDKLEILQFRGQTGAFLQPAPGEPQNNLIKMARAGLLSDLRTTLARAQKEMAPVRTEGVEIDQGGFKRTCALVVIPFTGLPHVKEPLFVVLFEEATAHQPVVQQSAASPRPANDTDPERIPKLEHQLSSTTEYLHSLIEEHSQINEELGSANEELISGNEELQSLNEELETAKEELQSTNEELTTVNDELNHRNQEVGQINSDLVNLLNTVDIPVIILDRQRHIRRFTPRAQKLMNVLPTDVGRLFDDIKPQFVAPDLDRQIADVIETFLPKESEVQDRAGRWYRMQIRPYKAADDTVDGAIISLVDIDALKGNVFEAQEGQADAERADRAKDEFLAVLSHELRTPLSVLVMQTHLLRQGGADSAKLALACDRIERSTRMQVRLIEDLLDVSRIVTGKMRIDLQPTALVAVVTAALDAVAGLAKSKSITLNVSLDHAVGVVVGDRLRLEQVVLNLLTNALKFTPKGGRIDVSLDSDGVMAHLKVRDNGVGIDAAFLPRIFNRLTQQDSSSTRRHAGLGLGLAIVRHLVDAHGGIVTAASPGPGQGATFHVALPLAKLAPDSVKKGPWFIQGIRSEHEAPPPRPIDFRVLVVEDDGGMRELLAEILTKAGATVRTADSAAAGMIAFNDFRPDVLCCDIAMPDEDGYGFISRIRALDIEQGGDTPALALTALAGDTDRLRALAGGFQMHLTKPINTALLTGALAELVATVRPDISP